MARSAVSIRQGRRTDLYHSLSLAFPTPAGAPGIYLLHDLPPARFEDEGTVPKWGRKAAANAAAIITPSEFAKREICELLGVPSEKVRVIPYGAEHHLFHKDVSPLSEEQLNELGIFGQYLIYSGGFTRRKNVRAMLEAWKLIEVRYPDLSLILAGPRDQLSRIVAESGAPRTIAIGYLGRDKMPGVLKGARALICPSIYEGFGMPPMEANGLGVPALVVRTGGALPEVVGNAAVYAESGESTEMAVAMQRVIEDESERDRVVEAGFQQVRKFCWKKHAEQTVDVYRTVLEA